METRPPCTCSRRGEGTAVRLRALRSCRRERILGIQLLAGSLWQLRWKRVVTQFGNKVSLSVELAGSVGLTR